MYFIHQAPVYSEKSGISTAQHWSYAISVTSKYEGRIRIGAA